MAGIILLAPEVSSVDRLESLGHEIGEIRGQLLSLSHRE